ncbi:phosphatase PAP2 family protein [Streptomyces gobiensis]|uniref:phosphatase PAP2 family protein n=1 Tax=Streptomyces gobiensis TaxID=2875706 RepID=UPI001E2C09A8|nr:phosphatase PAP2 family protein [Streptomyces gobiensis]UGY92855.1 phosphatase PAP2 family protein [Streptomyces gobiensis]
MAGWDNPDVDVLQRVNGLARSTPGWVDSTLGFLSEYGVLFGLMVLGVWAWWVARRRTDAVAAVAGLLWAPLAASVAYLVNFPIRELVARPRPFIDHQDLEVLVPGKTGFSFVSDHSTLTMAIAVGIFMVNRRFGLAAIALALFQGFGRVYAGVHYPTDVVGGFALGTAVVLLLAPLALALLTPLTRTIATSPRAGWLVRARSASETESGAGSGSESEAESGSESVSRERGLAA